MKHNFDQFGVPEENIKAAEKWSAKQKKRARYCTHVPTRKEAANLPVHELTPLLIGWMVHSPTEIIPSRVQIALVEEVLLMRPDVKELGDLLDKCRHYMRDQ